MANNPIIAVVKTAVPVNDHSIETSTHICREKETVKELWERIEKYCGNLPIVSIELTEGNQ